MVEVEFAAVKLASVSAPVTLVVPVKVLLPLKVLLFARSVEDAPVSALLQPNAPLLYESACDALLQRESPAPKKFVVDALVAKRLVAVALVMVAVVPRRLVRVLFVPVMLVALKLVAVALVVVLRRSPPKSVSFGSDVVAVRAVSKRVCVKYRLDPSATLVVKSPRDEVASC